ncbi:2-amino-4-hydroxy-6-hydroxymethyldihydropteridine diphosphokinase [Cellulomonas sp. ATA003]|uniref:2-amino-4-hydroxy-6- hydroxymethyldihydropteridine diphosphokinase n=1 Tax=Cellulomonas sp. ATA003 TaxID=3073064 RepID=UPI002872F2CF|nr:2-amino-4-hydroxy-6-hydroxymethyldihydropteridine diphosphokinase [Cellulomonas sp. ATA003]WNB85304.1 2-amino-4-hydroxy-6-hydroxymethyldihydropteridine diphosphokinase [Cellulomonas sp. ATA003]
MSTHPMGPALDDAGHPLDQIVLAGISATGYHGVFEHERREGQVFSADVVVHLDTRRAAAGDDLGRTVDYGVLAEKVAAVLAGDPADLIETVAERIAATALADQVVVAVDVAVHKPGAPVTVPFEDVVVRVRRDRQKLPAAAPWEAPPAATTGPGAGQGSSGPQRVADGSAAPEPDRLDEAPPVPVEAVLALGSNIGAPQSTLRTAVDDLGAIDGVEVLAVSPLARTAPVGGPEQPDFLNAVLLVRTSLAARALLRAVQGVEARHGRERREHWGPRTLDIDLITYDTTLAVTDDLELPHPRAHQRAFVLQPWAQIAPDAVLPGLGGGPVAALAATAPDRGGIRWLALDWMNAPVRHETDVEPAPDPAPDSVPSPDRAAAPAGDRER